MLRVFTAAVAASSLALAVAAGPASPAPPPVGPTVRTSAVDAPGDVSGAGDLTGFVLVQSGLGLAFTWTFVGPAPAAIRAIDICADTDSRRLCVIGGKQEIYVAGLGHIPARVNRRGDKMRVWVRAAHLGYAPGAQVTASASTIMHEVSCTPDCTDATDSVRMRYVANVHCTPRMEIKYTNGVRDTKLIALTFDDGPAPQTPRLLDILKANHVPASFFVVGRQIAARSDVLRRMFAEGEMVGNHSWEHADEPSSSSLSTTTGEIKRAIGVSPAPSACPMATATKHWSHAPGRWVWLR